MRRAFYLPLCAVLVLSVAVLGIKFCRSQANQGTAEEAEETEAAVQLTLRDALKVLNLKEIGQSSLRQAPLLALSPVIQSFRLIVIR